MGNGAALSASVLAPVLDSTKNSDTGVGSRAKALTKSVPIPKSDRQFLRTIGIASRRPRQQKARPKKSRYVTPANFGGLLARFTLVKCRNLLRGLTYLLPRFCLRLPLPLGRFLLENRQKFHRERRALAAIEAEKKMSPYCASTIFGDDVLGYTPRT